MAGVAEHAGFVAGRMPAPPRSARARASLPARVGWAVLCAVALACVASLPWSAGSVRVGATEEPRYSAGNLRLGLLPPAWRPLDADQQERVAQARAAGEFVPGRVLGTDRMGRDFLARVLMGGVLSLAIGLSAAAVAVAIGTTYGALSGYAGGRTDALMMRAVDVLYGLPSVLMVVLLAVAVDGLLDRVQDSGSFAERVLSNRSTVGLVVLLLAIGGTSWLTMSRVIRGQVLSLRAQPFMEGCRAVGVPVARQFTRHLLPNLVGPIVVYATLAVPTAILAESFLSFLGIGIREPLPTWGSLASEGLDEVNLVSSRWWLLAAPCALIATTLVALNFIGDWLRVRFDPAANRASW
jgi:oligopeptide transport system permease protein